MATAYQPAADDFSPDDIGPRRTSILAIISLILSLICIIPGAGILGAVFGLAGLIGIMQSKGRVGGTGLAVTGMILGLMFSAIWIGLTIGAVKSGKFFQSALMGPLNSVMTAIEAGDHDAARALFPPDSAALITDAQLDAFRDAYRAEMGNFQTIPQGVVDYFLGFQQVGPSMQGFGQAHMQNAMPSPAQFDKGWTAIAYEFVPNSAVQINTTGQGKPPVDVRTSGTRHKTKLQITNLAVFSQDGTKQIWLIDRGQGKPLSPAPSPDKPPAPPITPPVSPVTPVTPDPAPEPAGPDKGPG